MDNFYSLRDVIFEHEKRKQGKIGKKLNKVKRCIESSASIPQFNQNRYNLQPATLLKRDSGTGVFLRILRNL